MLCTRVAYGLHRVIWCWRVFWPDTFFATMRPGVRIPCPPPNFPNDSNPRHLCTAVACIIPPVSGFLTNRNTKLTAPWRFHGLLAFAIVVLLASCGKSHGRPHSVTVSWTAIKSPVVGCNVYRTSMRNGNVKKLTSQPITATQYVDSTVQPGLTYSYTVTSVDSKGNESRPSAPIVAKVPSP
jgi:hypothetical protein